MSPPPSKAREAAYQSIQNAGREGISANELLTQVQAVTSCGTAQLNRLLKDLRENERRIVRRWEWVETGPMVGAGYRTYRYWGVNFYMDAQSAPTCRDANGNPIPAPVILQNFHPQVEM